MLVQFGSSTITQDFRLENSGNLFWKVIHSNPWNVQMG